MRTNWVLRFLGTWWNQQHALGARRRLVLMREMHEHQQFWDLPRQTHNIYSFWVCRTSALSYWRIRKGSRLDCQGPGSGRLRDKHNLPRIFFHPPTLFCFVFLGLVWACLILFLQPFSDQSPRGVEEVYISDRSRVTLLLFTNLSYYGVQTKYRPATFSGLHADDFLLIFSSYFSRNQTPKRIYYLFPAKIRQTKEKMLGMK